MTHDDVPRHHGPTPEQIDAARERQKTRPFRKIDAEMAERLRSLYVLSNPPRSPAAGASTAASQQDPNSGC